MKALNDYIIVKVENKKEQVTKAGIIVAQVNEGITTNSGDRIGTATDFIVEDVGPNVEIAIQKGDKVILNLWQLQMFTENDTTYGVIPAKEVKVVL